MPMRKPVVLTTCLWAVLVFALFVLGAAASQAQDSLDDVYATMQYNVSLRAGPGTNWARLAVLPYSTTYEVTGRTQDADWIQIGYTGELLTDAYPEATIDGVTYGWVRTSLTFWTGNLLARPVDGVHTVNFVRGTLGLVLITAETPIYTGIVGPQQRVDYPLNGSAYVEATAYYGTEPHVWVQFKIGSDFYWVRRLSYSYSHLPNASMLIAGGRLQMLVSRNLSRLTSVYGDLLSRWTTLRNGQPVSCNNIPGDFALIGLLDNDVAREPVYAAVETGLNEAEASINSALTRLRAVCSTPEMNVSPEDIQAALNDLGVAEESLNVLRLLQRALTPQGGG